MFLQRPVGEVQTDDNSVGSQAPPVLSKVDGNFPGDRCLHMNSGHSPIGSQLRGVFVYRGEMQLKFH